MDIMENRGAANDNRIGVALVRQVAALGAVLARPGPVPKSMLRALSAAVLGTPAPVLVPFPVRD